VTSDVKICENCSVTAADVRAKLEDGNSEKHADIFEENFPNCLCEAISIGEGSPGVVSDTEELYRLLISPRDYDPHTQTVAEQPFRKVFTNGLSVCRSRASDDDLRTLAEEGLYRNPNELPKKVWLVCLAKASEVRELVDKENKLFCVYDQTVARRFNPEAAAVPTHAAIFLRYPAPGTPDRKRLQKDFAGELKELFLKRKVSVSGWRGDVLEQLNRTSATEVFILAKEEKT